MASISTSDSVLSSAEDSRGRSENVVLPEKETTLEFDEQEEIQLQQNNKLPKVWTVNENEEFNNVVLLTDVIDLIFEGEEHLWKR